MNQSGTVLNEVPWQQKVRIDSISLIVASLTAAPRFSGCVPVETVYIDGSNASRCIGPRRLRHSTGLVGRRAPGHVHFSGDGLSRRRDGWEVHGDLYHPSPSPLFVAAPTDQSHSDMRIMTAE